MVKFIESCVKLVTWNVHGLDNDMQQTSRNGKHHLEKLITDTEMIPITLETTRGI